MIGDSPDLASEFAPPVTGSKNRVKLGLCLLLAMVTFSLYTRAAHCAFINIDDPDYVTRNAHVRAGIDRDTLAWAFTTYDAANWHPLTWLSHALDWELFADNPAGHHYTNVLFHTANGLLLFLVLLSATGRLWPSWAVAALWAVHPANVESVAWIAERKNVLSMFFCLLALYAYGKFAEKPGLKRYVGVTCLFSLGLMAKPQIITLPMVLLLWDYWPLRRFDTASPLYLVAEKLPLLLLSAASGFITVQAQAAGEAIRTIAEISLFSRLENASLSYVRYLEIAFWPAGLSPIYLHPGNSISLAHSLAAAGLLLAISTLVLWRKKQRYLLVGWFWFLGTFVPTIGLVQVGPQAMADRYVYLPYIGLFVAVIWGAVDLVSGVDRRWPAIALAAGLCALSAVTYRQIGYWSNGETLWSRAVAVTERNYTAHTNLADALAGNGRSEEAIAQFEAAERIHSYPPEQMLTLGIYEQQHGHIEGAARQFQQAGLSPDPGLRSTALANLGSIYLQDGKIGAAAESFRQALQADPANPAALVGSGLIAYPEDVKKAVEFFEKAVAIQPTDVRLLLLSSALQKAGRSVQAADAGARARRATANITQAEAAADQLLQARGNVSK